MFTQLSKAGPGAGLADTIFSTKPATRVNREAHRSGSMPLCSRTSQLYSEAQDGFCGSDIWTGHSGGASLCSAKTQTAVNSQNGQELECSRRFLPHIWHQSPNDSRGGLSQPADQCQHVALLCDPGSHTACWVPGAVSTRTSPNPGRAASSEGHLTPIPLSIRADTHPPGWEPRGHRCHPWQRVKSHGRRLKPPGSQLTETGARAPAGGSGGSTSGPSALTCTSRKGGKTPADSRAPSDGSCPLPLEAEHPVRQGRLLPAAPHWGQNPHSTRASRRPRLQRRCWRWKCSSLRRVQLCATPMDYRSLRPGDFPGTVLVARRLQGRNGHLDPTLATAIREATGLGCWFPDLGAWLAVSHWHGNCLMLVWFPKAAG